MRFRDPLGCSRQVPWLEAAQNVVFEESPAVRPFPVRHGRRVAPGWWWSSTTGRLVAYGSGVMRTQLMLLDRDPAVVALACRPVELVWREESKTAGHAPQLMARLQDGSGLLLDGGGRSGPSARLAGTGTGCGGCRRGSGLVLPAGGAAGSGAGGQRAVAGGLPASPVRRSAVDAGSAGGLR
ncbi:TnsA-like heteromeric transposase endonuclease subunit, partial [Streptomyces zinciresistens]|uniref:TnsA-like heteromeric transposase endonuclease subunit n=1 Tax=Streptomyces zinciresistens TaxID=1073330 RepID=UPI001FCB96C7